MTSEMPPASYRSEAVKRPPGVMSATIGVRAAMVSNSSIDSGRFSSCASARRWSTALVEPPVAATAAIAFSIEALVTMLDGRTSWRTRVIASSPACRAAASLSGSSAGIAFRPAGDRPRNSMTMDIVFAVNWPPHAPAPGHAALSISYSSSRLILPAR